METDARFKVVSKPDFSCEITFAETNDGNRLRHIAYNVCEKVYKREMIISASRHGNGCTKTIARKKLPKTGSFDNYKSLAVVYLVDTVFQ